MHTVLQLDIQTHHEKDYIIKVDGQNDNVWKILCFSNSCMIMTARGLEEARAGDCFINSPKFIEYHYTPEDAEVGFINDWMHISSETLGQWIERLRLPTDAIIRTQHAEIMRDNMQKIINEKRMLLPFAAESIHNQVERILIKIARTAAKSDWNSYDRYEEELVLLRTEVGDHLERQWSLREMASRIGLSCSRFSVLYKTRFGSSPIDDLIQMRIDKSKNLLLSSSMTLEHIAQICGFKNEYYFSRVFKERENVTPGAFRKGY